MRRLVAAGADCIKILLYYTPFDPPDVNEIKHAWVERIGEECAGVDVPFFLEFVGYEEGGDEKSIGFARKKPDVVTQSMAEFSKPQYGVDILKVEVPVNMAYVAGSKACKGESAYTRDRPRNISGAPPQRAKKPFIYLSAGVSNDVFHRDAGTGGGNRREFFRRSLRARHLEGWHSGLREAGREGARRLARATRA